MSGVAERMDSTVARWRALLAKCKDERERDYVESMLGDLVQRLETAAETTEALFVLVDSTNG